MSLDQDPKKGKLITRRRFLPWVITVVAGTGFSLSLVRELLGSDALPPRPKYTGSTPRHRKKQQTQQPLSLNRGFYLYLDSHVIHYFPQGKAAPFYGYVDTNRLQPINPTQVSIYASKPQLPKPKTARGGSSKRALPPPHVDQSRASFAFEHEAVSQINEKNLQRAFDLLIYAIQFELQSDYGIKRLAKMPKWTPSFRLYDLLAGLSIRFDKVENLRLMIEVIQSSKNEKILRSFAGRIKKWQDPQSRWYKRWSNRGNQIKWTVDGRMGLVLLM